jgi:type VI secretion system secreted protein VgrG
MGDAQGGGSYKHGQLEVYDFPGRFKSEGEGARLAKIRLEAQQAMDHRCQASGDSVYCNPGHLIQL